MHSKRYEQVNRESAEKIITEYLKPVFGFALKRCKSIHDAEDLSQDIILKAYRALLLRDDIEDAGKFIWTVAHNALSNYYRDASKNALGISLDMIAETEDPSDPFSTDTDAETVKRLQGEIAYLSKMQRRIIIAYYYENRKQTDIADELGIPPGTVKWHLFEAKKELKRGMEKMRESNELKFNPVKFKMVGINGNAGNQPMFDYLRSALSQNICYDVRNEAKSVEEIADDLGVSPVYIEGEAEHLEEFGLLRKVKDKYIVNFLIEEPTNDFLVLQNNVYKEAASGFANALYDELVSCGVLDDPDIICGQTDKPIELSTSPRADRNFIMWSLIPYITACSEGYRTDRGVTFEEAATIRPDGGHNIVHASVYPERLDLPDDYVYMNNWCGPAVFSREGYTIWRIDSEWSDKRITVDNNYFENMMRVLGDYYAEFNGTLLSRDEYVWLSELGFIKTNGDYDGYFKSGWQPVILANNEINKKLLAIGAKIKAKFKPKKEEYINAALNTVPAHLRRVKEYELQFAFEADGLFLLHCIKALLDNGKLTLPTENQKRTVSTLIYPQ